MAWPDATRRRTEWHEVVLRGMLHCGLLWCGATQRFAAWEWCDEGLCGMLWDAVDRWDAVMMVGIFSCMSVGAACLRCKAERSPCHATLTDCLSPRCWTAIPDLGSTWMRTAAAGLRHNAASRKALVMPLRLGATRAIASKGCTIGVTAPCTTLPRSHDHPHALTCRYQTPPMMALRMTMPTLCRRHVCALCRRWRHIVRGAAAGSWP